MLDAMTGRLCALLCEKGLRAIYAYPDAPIDRTAPAVAVSVQKAVVGPGGYGDYIGLEGEEELFALRCDAQFALDICTEPEGGYAALSAEADRLAAALWALGGEMGAPALTLGQAEYDRKSGCLRCRCALSASFWLVRRPEETPGTFSGFTVKGMILHGNE
jgi:hypothetical protein